MRQALHLSTERNDNGSSDELLSLSVSWGVVPKVYDHESQVRSGDDLRKYFLVRPGQFVVNPMWLMHGSLGTASIHGVISPDYRVYDPAPKVDARYVHHLLKTKEYQQLYGLLARGTTTYDRRISKDAFNDLPVLLPPPLAQTAIADFLDRKTAAIDALIEKKQKLLDLLAEKRAALINQAVTKGLDPNVPMRDSGIPWIGEIPAHWQVKRLKYVCTLETGHTPSRSEPAYWVEEECIIPWVSLNDTKTLKKADSISETAYTISPLGMANSAAHLIPAGAVVFTRDATIGLTAIIAKPMAVSQHIIGWVCGPELVNTYLLRVMDSMGQELDRLTFGATLKTIGMGAVKELTTPLPSVDEQDEIVGYLRRTLDRLGVAQARLLVQMNHLHEYRQALITAAVTGQLDVTEPA